MIPFQQQLPDLARYAEQIIKAAEQEIPDTGRPTDFQTRLQRSAHVTFVSKSFTYNRIHQLWDAQSQSETGRRTIFTPTGDYCTCLDKTRGRLPCKHLIALAKAVLEYQSK